MNKYVIAANIALSLIGQDLKTNQVWSGKLTAKEQRAIYTHVYTVHELSSPDFKKYS